MSTIPPCTDDPNEVIEKIVGIKEESDKFSKFVNGTAFETVQLGSGDATPTIRHTVRLMKSAAAEIDEADVSGKSAAVSGGSELRMLEDRFSDMVSVKDFGGVGDGETDDTAAFEALEAEYAGRKVDLLGHDWVVDSIPDRNSYVNGWFKMDGMLFPTPDIYGVSVARVSPENGCYNAWPQDSAHTWGGVIYTFYGEDVGHASDAQHPVLAFSTDGGSSFPFAQHLSVGSTGKGAAVFSAGVTARGTQLAILHKDLKGSSYNVDRTLRLIGRKCFEYIQYSDQPYPYSSTISSTSGSSSYTFTMENGHGLVPGDTVSLYGSQSIGGNTFSDEVLTVASVESLTSCTLTCGIEASATETVQLQEANLQIRLNEYGKFHELLFDGSLHLGAKLKAVTGASDDPTLAHCMCIVGDDAYFCIHGRGYSGSYIVKISSVSLPTRSLTVRQISTQGVEGTLADLGNGFLIGALRTEGDEYPLRFFAYNISTGDVSFQPTRFGTGHFIKSPAPVRIVGTGDNREAVYCFTENRGGAAGTRHVVIAHAKVSDIAGHETNFEPFLRYEAVAEAWFGHTNAGESSATGVPSLTSIGGEVFLFVSSDHPMAIADRDGFPHVYCCRLDFSRWVSDRLPIPSILPSAGSLGMRSNLYSSAEWQNVKLHTRIYGDRSETAKSLRRGLRAEFDSSSSAVNLVFQTEDSGTLANRRDFSIGHDAYAVHAVPNNMFQSLDGEQDNVGIWLVQNKTGEGFSLRGRMVSIINGGLSYRDGLVTTDVDVYLEKPVDWLELS